MKIGNKGTPGEKWKGLYEKLRDRLATEHMKSPNNEVWLDDPLPLFKILEDKCAFGPSESPLS
jgi:hypothetical protein